MQRVRLTLFAVAAAGMLAGCATTKPIGFIATPGYVESRIATSENAMRADYEARLAEKDRQISQLQAELRAQRQVTEDLAGLADVVMEVESSNRELRDLAVVVEDRLAELPRETIRELVRALERYLEEEPGR